MNCLYYKELIIAHNNKIQRKNCYRIHLFSCLSQYQKCKFFPSFHVFLPQHISFVLRLPPVLATRWLQQLSVSYTHNNTQKQNKELLLPLVFLHISGRKKKKIPEPPQLTSPHISLAKLCHVPRPDQSLAIGNGTTDVYLDKNSANYSPKVSPPSVFECPVS